MNLLSACRQTARRTFRIPSLRPEQESAMLAVLNGRDALVALSVGFGKSLHEAHCISEWGHDFRPSYLRLGDARKRLGNPPALALSATATPRVREDIAERLRLDKPRVLVAPGSPRKPSPHRLAQ